LFLLFLFIYFAVVLLVPSVVFIIAFAVVLFVTCVVPDGIGFSSVVQLSYCLMFFFLLFLLLFICFCFCFTDVVAALYFISDLSFIENVSFAFVIVVMLSTLSSIFFENCSPG
jgi:hypothetical protein